MKYAVIAARVLLGLMFLVFGLNNILHFMPTPPQTPSDATTYGTILMAHGVMTFVGVLMTISGLLILVGRFVPLGLVMLAPILVNILLFHFLIAHGGAAIGLVATVLEVFLIVVYRRAFVGLFHPDPLSLDGKLL